MGSDLTEALGASPRWSLTLTILFSLDGFFGGLSIVGVS